MTLERRDTKLFGHFIVHHHVSALKGRANKAPSKVCFFSKLWRDSFIDISQAVFIDFNSVVSKLWELFEIFGKFSPINTLKKEIYQLFLSFF